VRSKEQCGIRQNEDDTNRPTRRKCRGLDGGLRRTSHGGMKGLQHSLICLTISMVQNLVRWMWDGTARESIAEVMTYDRTAHEPNSSGRRRLPKCKPKVRM
jgi:hypothetical protein